MTRSPQALQAALAAHHAGKLQEAERGYRRILRAQPEHAEALHCLGLVLHQSGQHERALFFLDRAVQKAPHISQVHNNRASVLSSLGRHADALESLAKARALAPDDPGLDYNQGNSLMALERYEEAAICFARAIELAPDLRQAQQNLAVLLTRRGRHDEALAAYDRLIALDPSVADWHQKRGEALLSLSRFEAAIEAFTRAATLSPSLVAAHENKGWALSTLNRRTEALAACDAALAQDPDFALAHWTVASIALALGDYARGWREMEWRWREPTFLLPRRMFETPLWLGDFDIAGKTVFLYAEQGFGDTIQFSRFVAEVANRGARVILEVQKPLRDLMETLKGWSEMIVAGDPVPPHDAQCTLMSLPLALGTRLETVPRATPYLAVDPERAARWSALLGPKDRPRIGLAWSGNPTFKADHLRSAPLQDYAPFITPDFEFFAVQKDVRAPDAAAADRMGIRLLGDETKNFADAAALTSLMDLVVTVDSSPAHLAGALGKPVWVLLTFAAEWRWLMDRADSPWYPTARLFRQTTPMVWSDVAQRVQEALLSENFA